MLVYGLQNIIPILNKEIKCMFLLKKIDSYKKIVDKFFVVVLVTLLTYYKLNPRITSYT